MDDALYSTSVETSPQEMLNIIEKELSELIGAGCSQMFIQSLSDEIVGEDTLTREAVSKIYRELHKELLGLLGKQGLNTLNRRVTNALMERWGFNLLELPNAR